MPRKTSKLDRLNFKFYRSKMKDANLRYPQDPVEMKRSAVLL